MAMDNQDESTNPYQAPVATTGPDGDLYSAGDDELRSVFRSLARWQTFFAVLALVIAIFAFFGVAIGTLFGRQRGDLVGAVFMLLLMSAVAVFFYLVPAVLLFRAASSARNAAADANEPIYALFRTQLAFWRYVGILAIIVLAIYAIVIAGAVLGVGLYEFSFN